MHRSFWTIRGRINVRGARSERFVHWGNLYTRNAKDTEIIRASEFFVLDTTKHENVASDILPSGEPFFQLTYFLSYGTFLSREVNQYYFSHPSEKKLDRSSIITIPWKDNHFGR
jgi:hypothetical protein